MAQKSKKETPEDKLLQEAKDNLELVQDSEAEVENRSTFREDTKFENGDMWDPKAQQDREDAGRPCLKINKCAPVVKQILGDARQNKIQIKVKPVDNEQDPAKAKIYDGLINNIENVSSADTAYDTALGFSVRGGWGYFRVITEYSDEEAFDQDIKINRIINPLSVYMDPSAQRLDRADIKWAFILDTMTRKEFEKSYPNSIVKTGIQAGLGDQEKTWISEETVQVAEYFRIVYKKETLHLMAEDGRTIRASSVERNNHEVVKEETAPGVFSEYLLIGNDRYDILRSRETDMPKVEWCKTNGVEILEGPTEFPCKYIPIIFVPGDEVWIDGKQILRSALKWAKEPNRLYNWARSNSVERMAGAPLQPFLITPEELAGYEIMWDEANTKPMPYLLYNRHEGGGIPQRQQGSMPDVGADREAQMASDDIKSTTGIYDASLGAAGNEKSGVAIRERKRQGDTGTYVFTDNLVTAIEHLGRILVNMIPRVYDTERVVRLLNVDGSEAWETINQTIVNPADGSKTVLNDLSVGKFDVVATAGPAYGTKRIEAADGMERFMTAVPLAAPVVAPRLAKMLDWDDADEIGDELKAALGGAPEGEEGQAPPEPPPNPEEELKLEGQVLTNQGKELDNEKKAKDLIEDQQEQDDRMKGLIIEALQDVGLVPQTPGGPE